MSFKAVQAKMAKKQGVSKEEAGAELAASTRKASPAAKAKNQALKKVKMPKKKMAKGGCVKMAKGGMMHGSTMMNVGGYCYDDN